MTALYVHWPYCLSKCPYCDFNSHVASTIDHEAFEDAYMREIDHFANHIAGKHIPSIFFGGGTPSLMPPKLVAKIIDKIVQVAKVDADTEITLEANPTSSEAKKFIGFRDAGVNRLSIGVQSLRAGDLKALGREHNVDEALKAIEMAAQVFSRTSFDLIYARSGQTLAAWQDELREAMQIAPGHISLYQLTIEKGTPFYKRHKEGEVVLPENDTAADMYLWTNDFLKQHGYGRYEISNYAKLGQECRHNLAYWHYDEYLGIGPGAHSRLQGSGGVDAVMNWHKPEKWLAEVAEKGRGVQKRERLTQEELVSEILMMGLRLEEGVDERRLRELTGLGFEDCVDMEELRRFAAAGFLAFDTRAMLGNLKLTDKGLLLHSYIVPRLMTH